MQKDVHYYLTYALALKSGLNENDSKLVAWADQYTDELMEPDVFEIQTQCGPLGDWYDVKTQYTVLIPFHFMPGDDYEWKWKTTENCTRANSLVKNAIKNNDLLQLGIALHTLQDTFSHQGFSGWREDNNSCYKWYNLSSISPNIGHAEMRYQPDDAAMIWVDPRDKSKKEIDNTERVIKAAKVTFKYLCNFSDNLQWKSIWKEISPLLTASLKELNYDNRKKKFNTISGVKAPRYKKITGSMQRNHKNEFTSAANYHFCEAMQLMKDIPRYNDQVK